MLSHAANAQGNCSYLGTPCLLYILTVQEFDLHASWRQNYFDQWDFLMRSWEQQRHMSPIWQFPNFNLKAHAVGSCLLHSIGQVQMLVTESHQNRNELPCFCTLGLNFGALEAFFLIMVSVRVASLSEETPWFLYSCKICLYNSPILAVIVLPGILLWRSNKMLPAASCAQPESTTCNQSKRRTPFWNATEHWISSLMMAVCCSSVLAGSACSMQV